MNVEQKISGWKKASRSPKAFVLYAIILLLIVIIIREKEIPETKTSYMEPPKTDIYIGFTDLGNPRMLPIYTGEERYAIRTKFSCFWKFMGLWDRCEEATYYHTLVIAESPLGRGGQSPDFYIRAGTNRPVKSMVNFSSESLSPKSKCKQEENNVLLCALAEDLTNYSVDNIKEIRYRQPIGSVPLKFSEVKSKMTAFAEVVNSWELSYDPKGRNCNTVASKFINYIGLDSGEILKAHRHTEGPAVFPGWELPNGYTFPATEPIY